MTVVRHQVLDVGGQPIPGHKITAVLMVRKDITPDSYSIHVPDDDSFNGADIVRQLSAVSGSDGWVELNLVPNEYIFPSGSYYRIYGLGTERVLLWVYPSVAPVSIGEARVKLVDLEASNLVILQGPRGSQGITADDLDAAIDAAVASLVEGAPGALDTLNELAAALGDDANFATTIANQLATKVNSSTYTAGLGTKQDKLTPTATKTASYTAAVLDEAVMDLSGGPLTVTLPTAPANGAVVGVRALNASATNALTVQRGGTSDTIGAAGASTATLLLSGEFTVYRYNAALTRWLPIDNVKPLTALDARYINTDDVGNPATADGAALRAAFVSAAWKANTAYLTGQKVVNPSNQIVAALADFTSGATYNAANWTTPASGGGSSSASDLTSGTLAPARIADSSLPFTKMTGQLADAQIPDGIARDTEVASAVAALVASAPTTLDTLAEIATALGNDPNLSTTLTTAIGAKYTKPAGGIPAADLAADAATQAEIDPVLASAGYNGTFVGAWSARAFNVNDVVTVESGLLRCTVAHTGNAAGGATSPVYDREKWEAIPLPIFQPGTTVPARGLLWSAPGVAGANPRAGAFQRRPKQFARRDEIVLWAPQAAADVTLGGSGSVADGTAAGGSVTITVNASSQVTAASPARAAVNLTDKHLVVTFKTTVQSGRGINLDITSGGTDYTNYLTGYLNNGSVDGLPVNQWLTVSIPLTEFTTVGTGADVTAITGVRLRHNSGANVVDLARISARANAATKAKCVLWTDDGGFAAQLTAAKTAARYGFPITVASIANNLVNASAGFSADQARYMQDNLGAQFAVHAYGSVDHNRIQAGATLFEQLLNYQHFGLASGLHGVEDMAYWSTGFQGPFTDELELTARKLFRSGRGGRSRLTETLPPGAPLNTRAMMTTSADTSTGTWQPYAQRAIAHKGLAQFVWHDMTAGILTEFATFCAWLDTQRANIDVVTPQQAFDPLCV